MISPILAALAAIGLVPVGGALSTTVTAPASPAVSACTSFTGATSYPIGLCARGDAVRVIQDGLRLAGADIEVDGRFGAGTDAAVRTFQTAEGLPVDGAVGRDTWLALVAAGAPAAGADLDSSGLVDPWEVGKSAPETPPTADWTGMMWRLRVDDAAIVRVDGTETGLFMGGGFNIRDISEYDPAEPWYTADQMSGAGGGFLFWSRLESGSLDEGTWEVVAWVAAPVLTADQFYRRPCNVDGSAIDPDTWEGADPEVVGVIDDAGTVYHAWRFGWESGTIETLDATLVYCLPVEHEPTPE